MSTTTPESYVHLSTDKKTFTFYFDALRADRDGTTWGIEESQLPAWTSNINTTILTVVFDTTFRGFRPTTTARWFQFFKSLKHIEGMEHLNTAQVTEMNDMFSGCKSLTSLDLSSLDTSNVTNMGCMFSGCSSLTSLDLPSFDTRNVTNMGGMFSACNSLISLDLSSFDTRNVTNMGGMFSGCNSVTSLDLSSFDTSSVKNMGCLLSGCNSLTFLDLYNFDTSSVTNMGWMFSDCSSLTAIDLSSFDTSKVKEMTWMFSECKSLISLDLYNFDTSNVTNMSYMFYCCCCLTTIYCNSSWSCDESDKMFFDCPSLNEAMGLNGWRSDVSMAKTVRGYFTKKVWSQEDEAYVVHSLDRKRLTFYYDRERENRFGTIWCIEGAIEEGRKRIPAWQSDEVASKEDVAKIVIDKSFRNFVPKIAAGWFEGLSAVTEIRGLDNLNTSEATDLSRMFAGCSALRSLDVSRFDTLNVTKMRDLFAGCSALLELDLYFFDTSMVNDMSGMFKGCESLSELDFSSFNTSQVTDMHEMFKGCAALSALNLAHFDTSQVTDLHAMFKDCQRLTTLDLSNFQTSEVKNMRDMFSGCSALTTIWSFAFRNCFDSDAMFYECTSLRGTANFNEKYTDARMANPERGYFSRR